MKYTRKQKIRFKDCDYAGIVFYPKFFEMLNDLVEDWFEELGTPFFKMHDKEINMGVPAVNISCDFKRPGYMGEEIIQELSVKKIGNSSCTLDVKFSTSTTAETILVASITIVCIDLVKKQSKNWDTDMKEKFKQYMN